MVNDIDVTIITANAAITTQRLAALVSWRKDMTLPYWLPNGPARISAYRKRPKVTILVPLYKEDAVLSELVNALKCLDYPAEYLEVIFLLEEVDSQTANALSCLRLPEFISTLTIPEDWLQTKPKAMNYAVPFCTGEIIGIYDAEDRPESDQITKVVGHFLAAPANVACVQGYLDFCNSRANWISRYFTIEYATWFRIILKGIQALGPPIPLGGTTVFFRRSILEKIGGWDAHNVTEDADLGMRLARFGYRCEMVNTTTWEEANNNALPWIRQRSRWLKWVFMTWVTHMRNPAALLDNLGLIRFLNFQVVLPSGLSAFLAVPVFWALWLAHFAIPAIPVNMSPSQLWWLFAVVLTIGQAVNLTAIILATGHKHLRHLRPYILTLPFYWPLGMCGAYKAIAELFFAPFYWDKTAHGKDQEVNRK